MRAKLIALDSAHVDLESFIPAEEAFSLTVTAHIGVSEQDGADMFDFEVCSPEWLSSKLQNEVAVQGRNKIIMNGFNVSQLATFLSGIVGRVEGESWEEIRRQLAGVARWEFDA